MCSNDVLRDGGQEGLWKHAENGVLTAEFMLPEKEQCAECV